VSPQQPSHAGAPLRLAFIDPGLRKAPYFLELRKALAPVHCLYWSQRPVVRSYMHSAGVAMHPATRQPGRREHDITEPELRQAIGDKELALRPAQALKKARRLLAQLADFLDGAKVDAILVWNGSNLRGALAVHLARQRRLIVIYAEHGYLPGTTQLDRDGVNFNASISQLVRNGAAQLPADPLIDAALDADIARYKTGQPRVDAQPRPTAELRRNVRARLASHVGLWMERRLLPRANRISVPVARATALPQRYVLLPFQVRSDSQLLLHSPLYGNDLEAVVRDVDAALARIDPSLRLVAKFHPQELPQVQFGYRGLPRRLPRVCFIDAPMRQLLGGAAAVVTINSTAGFEALLYDKPVLALGRNFYTTPGLVECLERREDLEAALRITLARAPDHERRRAFLRYTHARFLASGHYQDFSARSLHAFAARTTELLARSAPA
jgi:capsular polysaccharide export protein